MKQNKGVLSMKTVKEEGKGKGAKTGEKLKNKEYEK